MPVRFYPVAELAPGADLTLTPSNWSWTDITSYVHHVKAEIIRGKRDRYATTSWARLACTLQNPNGIWVPDNPMSPYYGLIDLNTPIRLLCRPNDNHLYDLFARTSSSSWGSADSGGAWTNTGGAASDYSVAAASGGRHLHTAASVLHHSTQAVSLTRIDITVRVRVNALSTGAAQSAGIVCRYVDASNHRRGELQFATSGVISGRLVQRDAGVDTVIATVASTLTHTAANWYRIRLQTGQTSARFKVWADGSDEPATWLIDGAAGVFISPVAGAAGLYSRRETGNTNANATIDFDDFDLVDGPQSRFTGFTDAWPTDWTDISAVQNLARITVSGQLRRVSGQGTLKSALYRAHTENYLGSDTLVGYWSMEDASGAQSFASAVAGGAVIPYTDMSPASDSSIVGSDPLPTCGEGSIWSVGMPTYAAATSWAVRHVMKIPASPSTGTGLLTVLTEGTIPRWVLGITPGTPDVVKLEAYDAGGTEVLGDPGVNFLDSAGVEPYDRQLYLEVNATQNGGNIDWDFTVWFEDPDPNIGPTSVGRSGSEAGTIGNVTRVFHTSYPGLVAGGHTMGHLGVSTDVNFGAGSAGITGYAGESTQDRFGRLCTEENIPSFFGEILDAGTGTTEQLMGVQRTTSLIEQLREVESTEEGILFDGLQGQVTLLPRQQRENHAIELTLDKSLGQVGFPLPSTWDDFLYRNDVKASRPGGSFAVAQDLDGIRSIGLKSDPVNVNSETDADLINHANWRLGMGRARRRRYPQITLDFKRNPGLIASWLACDIGSRIRITGLPTAETFNDLYLLVEGYTELIDPFDWTVTINTSPAEPWNVLELDDNILAELETSGSTLAAGYASGVTSFSVLTPSGPLWSTTAADFDVDVAGERITVTTVAGAASPQTFTVVRSVNGVVKAQASGAQVRLWSTGVLAL